MASSQQNPEKQIKKRRKTAANEARKKKFMKKINDGNEETKLNSFAKRKPTLFKKAVELQTLCDVEVCVICYDPFAGKVELFPEKPKINDICQQYLKLDNKYKKEWNYLDFIQAKKKKVLKKKEKTIDGFISSLSNWLDGLSGNSLTDSVNELEAKLNKFNERIEFLKLNQGAESKTVDREADQQWSWHNNNGSLVSSTEYPLNLESNSDEFGFDFEKMDKIIGSDWEAKLGIMGMDAENQNRINDYVGSSSSGNICNAVPISVWKPPPPLNFNDQSVQPLNFSDQPFNFFYSQPAEGGS